MSFVHTHKSLSANQTKVQLQGELEHQEPHGVSASAMVTFVSAHRHKYADTVDTEHTGDTFKHQAHRI